MIENFKKELIALEVIRTLHAQFVKFPEDASNNRNAPFHEAFLKAFGDKLENKVADIPIFISLGSWLHGLNTSLGQSFFEKVGQILCDGEKREFKGLKISVSQQSKVSDIIAELKNKKRIANFEQENQELFDSNEIANKAISNFTADIFFEDADTLTAIELKTVKPNSSVFKAEKTKILEAKAALKRLYPDKKVQYYLGFPFDPLAEAETAYNKERYRNYSVDFKTYVDINEVLLARELWDYLSGEEGTMQMILDVINKIATTEFMDNYECLYNQKENLVTQKEKYLELLERWYLFREKTIVENLNSLQKLATTDRQILRILNQKLFNHKIEYNEKRSNIILNKIKK